MSVEVRKLFSKGLVVSALSSLFAVNAYAQFFQALPETKPMNGYALWFAPHFDFDSDGCLPDAGISRDGQQNGGLKNSGSITGGCRHSGFMNLSNTYHRYVCKTTNATYCAHVYALYFQKDQAVAGTDAFGHRHDWEYTVVWTRNGQPTHFSTSAHGKLSTKAWKDVPKDGNHPKAVYHKDGGLTHAFRMAKWGESKAENPTGKWVRPPLASFYTMKGNVGNKKLTENLSKFDYVRANVPVTHEHMLSAVNRFKPSGYPSWSSQDMWNSK
ncbi:NPP1 family protein [Vibrio quintilis]|uniref:Necrosis inducing protein (NPP1) n=1 Tax=Vibrio quintilis TaxID=1117707 RepID=A0A1M7YS60_9VIBR|nr:NPP1 family protein [Vibrio quintilis]SHO55443.1 Necrosis inducing protein (NPP1) [Vibrio quintilis]